MKIKNRIAGKIVKNKPKESSTKKQKKLDGFLNVGYMRNAPW